MLTKHINHEERTAAWRHKEWSAICCWDDEFDAFVLQITNRPPMISDDFEHLVSIMP